LLGGGIFVPARWVRSSVITQGKLIGSLGSLTVALHSLRAVILGHLLLEIHKIGQRGGDPPGLQILAKLLEILLEPLHLIEHTTRNVGRCHAYSPVERSA
jgi:hypothetical protein